MLTSQKPWARRVVMSCAMAVVGTVLGVVGVAPAAYAAGVVCRTKGHAYLIFDGVAYFSNYEDERTNPIRQLHIPRSSRVYLAGNGILPGQQITFFDFAGGTDEFGNLRDQYHTTSARSNCVVHQEPNEWQVNPELTPGTRVIIFADYVAGYDSAHDAILTAPVVELIII